MDYGSDLSHTIKLHFIIGDYVRNLLVKFVISNLFLWEMSSDFTSILGSRRSIHVHVPDRLAS